MAYMNQERKKALAPAIKKVCEKYGVKATLSVRNYSTLILNVKSGKLDFTDYLEAGKDPNLQYFKFNDENSEAEKFIVEVREAMNIGNWDKSDRMVDYFDVGWYTEINVGKWDKPYEYVP